MCTIAACAGGLSAGGRAAMGKLVGNCTRAFPRISMQACISALAYGVERTSRCICHNESRRHTRASVRARTRSDTRGERVENAWKRNNNINKRYALRGYPNPASEQCDVQMRAALKIYTLSCVWEKNVDRRLNFTSIAATSYNKCLGN